MSITLGQAREQQHDYQFTVHCIGVGCSRSHEVDILKLIKDVASARGITTQQAELLPIYELGWKCSAPGCGSTDVLITCQPDVYFWRRNQERKAG